MRDDVLQCNISVCSTKDNVDVSLYIIHFYTPFNWCAVLARSLFPLVR